MAGASDVLVAAAKRIIDVQNVANVHGHHQSLYISLQPLHYCLRAEDGEEGDYFEFSRDSSLGQYPDYTRN